MKLAVMAQKARAQLDVVARSEPIAIVGMGCRFPGGADSPDAYWELLRNGVDAVDDVPRDRWDVDALFDPDPAVPGKISAATGGFLDDIAGFDANFFGIIGREAQRMDPQHRVFLEVATEALDHAGLGRHDLAGSSTGVFVASYYNDYAVMQYNDPEWIDARTLTGTQHSVLANRLSYLLDLRGPSVSVDTACSSSLVAVHLACQSLRTGDSDVALAGGVSLMVSEDMMITLSKVGFMSPTGRCRTFDAAADGFVRGEGCGVIVLKRLADAVADDDRVLGVIRGSAVNQDGHSTVLTAPSGPAQEDLVREALANAQLTPDRVGYVEAHGTATPIGDPIEVEALAAVIGAQRADGSECYLGSAKANIGHLEAASGVAGVIKATLVLQHGEIPAQVHYATPNPHLMLDGTCLRIADQHREWPASDRPRVAGVSGFGVGGTNAHVLIEEATPVAGGAPSNASTGPHLVSLSARSPEALRALADRWVDAFSDSAAPLAPIAATAGSRRSHHDHRLAVVAETTADLTRHLQGFLDDDPGPMVAAGVSGGEPRLAFVFSGQGAQWATMGAGLAATEPVVRDTLAAFDERFRALGDWSLLDELQATSDRSRLDETYLAQPAIFALQVALFELWAHRGIAPDAVLGHSVGEIAALHVAGVLSVDDAVRVVWHRGRIMQQATGLGRMLSVATTPGATMSHLAELDLAIDLAAVNAPESVVLAGPTDAIAAAEQHFADVGVSTRPLDVNYAFHSAQVEPFRAELVETIGAIATQPATRAVYSTVTGERIDHGAIDAEYFGRNMRQTVQFADAMENMSAGVDVIVEVAPHPVLSVSIGQCLEATGRSATVAASMRRNSDEKTVMLQACAAVYAAGRSPNWTALSEPSVPVDLPAYPWQHTPYWVRADEGTRHRSTGVPVARTGLLGEQVSGTGEDTTFRQVWPNSELSWLNDHVVGGTVVMPGTAMLDLLRQAAQAAGGTSSTGQAGVTIADFVVHRPLALDDSCRGWTTAVTGDDVSMWVGDESMLEPQCIASARVVSDSDEPDRLAVTPAVSAVVSVDELYDNFDALGVTFGPSFRTLTEQQISSDGAETRFVERPTSDERQRGDIGTSAVLPTVLDGAFQLCLVAAASPAGSLPTTLAVPLAVDSYRLVSPDIAVVSARVRLAEAASNDTINASIELIGPSDELVARLDGVRLLRTDASSLTTSTGAQLAAYEVRWHAEHSILASDANAVAIVGDWVVLSSGVLGDALAANLTDHGGTCHLVRPADGAELGAIVSEVAATAQQFAGVVHAWSLDLAAPTDREVSGAALDVLQSIARLAGDPPSVWLVTAGAQPVDNTVTRPALAGLWGVVSVAEREFPDVAVHAADLDDPLGLDTINALAKLVVSPSAPRRIGLRAGVAHVPQLHRAPSARVVGSKPTEHRDAAALTVEPGEGIDGLRWKTISPPTVTGANDAVIHVEAAALNFRDVLVTLGMYPGDVPALGAECAGVVTAVGSEVDHLAVGDRVFGFVHGSLRTDVVADARRLRRLPPSTSMAQAAALPVAYLTAMYGLERIAAIKPGTRVLVHAAAGGVGQAAVAVAQRVGAEIYATAGSPAKRQLLRDHGIEHVFDSRSTEFRDGVLAATNGDGVDVVLNSLADELIDAGVDCLAADGCFLEIGKRGIWTPEQFATKRPAGRLVAYDFGTEADADPKLVGSLLDELDRGGQSPMPIRSFGFDEAADAFRLIAQARHVGKVVLTAPRRTAIRSDGTYWVTGGLGALGLRTARWLAESGASTVVLTSRSEPSDTARVAISEVIALGAAVYVRRADAGDRAEMTAVFDEVVSTLPPLRGVFHAAGVVDDGPMIQQTWERWKAVLDAKSTGADLLDELTRSIDLDLFVSFSAAGVVLGSAGQGAYADANARLDALSHDRQRRGLAATSIGWGQWSHTGMAARLAIEGIDAWSERGMGWIEPADAFDLLADVLRDGRPHVAAMGMDWSTFVDQLPEGADRAFFAPLTRPAPAGPPVGAASGSVEPGAPTLVDVWEAQRPADRRRSIYEHVIDRTRHVLGVDDDVTFEERVALKESGLDSLMAVELRNVLTRTTGRSLPATLLFDYPTLQTLVDYLVTTLGFDGAAEPPKPELKSPSFGDDVALLSDAEAEALLLAELDGPSETP